MHEYEQADSMLRKMKQKMIDTQKEFDEIKSKNSKYVKELQGNEKAKAEISQVDFFFLKREPLVETEESAIR